MAIVIKNGRAVVVPDETTQQTAPTSYSQLSIQPSTQPSVSGGEFDSSLGASLLSNFKQMFGEAKEDITRRPVESLLDIIRGAGKGLVGGFRTLASIMPTKFLFEKTVPGYKEAWQEKVGEPLAGLAEKVGPTTKTGKTISPLTELLPFLVGPTPEIKALSAIPKVGKILAKGIPEMAKFATAGQLSYLPEKGKEELKGREERLVQDLVGYPAAVVAGKAGGAVLKGMGKVAGKAIKPIAGKVTSATGRLLETLGYRPDSRILAQAVPYWGRVQEELAKRNFEIPHQDIVDTLTGKKPVDNAFRAFANTMGNYSNYIRENVLKYPEGVFKGTEPVKSILGLPEHRLAIPERTPTSLLEELKTTLQNFAGRQTGGEVIPQEEKMYAAKLMRDLKTATGKDVSQEVKKYFGEMKDYLQKLDGVNTKLLSRETAWQTREMFQRMGIPDLAKLKSRLSEMERANDSLGAEVKLQSLIGDDWKRHYDLLFGIEKTFSPAEFVDLIRNFPSVRDMGVVSKVKPKLPGLDIGVKVQTVERTPEELKTAFQKNLEQLRSSATEPKFDLGVQTPQEGTLAQPALKILRPMEKPAIGTPPEVLPKVAETPKIEIPTEEKPLINQFDITPENAKDPSLVDKLKLGFLRVNPWTYESDKLMSYGPQAKEIVARSRRAIERAILERGNFLKTNKSLGLDALKPEEWSNVRSAMEGKVTPIDQRTFSLVDNIRVLFDEWGGKLGIEKIPNYWPRVLNEEGRKYFASPEGTKEIVDKLIAESGGKLSREEALAQFNFILKQSKNKAFFEYHRLLKDLPEKYREDPMKELFQWQNETARRFGVIQEFGKGNEKFNLLKSQLVEGTKTISDEIHVNELADKYFNKILGKSGDITDLAPLFNFFKSAMVVGKINPLTTVANESQAFLNSYLLEGASGLKNTMTKLEPALRGKLGLETLRGKIGDEFAADKFATKWIKAVGMESSEMRGFGRSASATYKAIESAWNKLKANPKDADMVNLLKQYGMFVDDSALDSSLRSGMIPDDELKLGILEGVRKKMFYFIPGERPAWASSQAGSTAYIFHNYLLSQLKLLANAPLHRQLIYLGILAPLTGLPVMTLRRVISGQELPKNPADWFVSSSLAGSATLFDVLASLSSPSRAVSFAAGGFGPALSLMWEKNKPKKALETAGFPTILSNLLFREKKK